MNPIEARKYNCMIELWETVNDADGYGGVTTTENLVGDIFARRIENRGSNYDVVAGSIDKFDQSFIIRARDIDTTLNFVVYKDYKYTILNVEGTQMQTQIRIDCVNTNTKRITPIIVIPSV
jgi:head-tail adaptor